MKTLRRILLFYPSGSSFFPQCDFKIKSCDHVKDFTEKKIDLDSLKDLTEVTKFSDWFIWFNHVMNTEAFCILLK